MLTPQAKGSGAYQMKAVGEEGVVTAFHRLQPQNRDCFIPREKLGLSVGEELSPVLPLLIMVVLLLLSPLLYDLICSLQEAFN